MEFSVILQCQCMLYSGLKNFYGDCMPMKVSYKNYKSLKCFRAHDTFVHLRWLTDYQPSQLNLLSTETLFCTAGLGGDIHLLMHPACCCALGVCWGWICHRQVPKLTSSPLQDHAGGKQQRSQCWQDDGEGVVASGGQHNTDRMGHELSAGVRQVEQLEQLKLQYNSVKWITVWLLIMGSHIRRK